MKKILAIVLVLVVVAGAGVAVVMLKPGGPSKAKAVSLDSVLPAGAMAVIQARDIEKNMTTFTQSQFWQKLSVIDVKGTMEKSGAKPEDLANLDRITQQLFSPTTQTIVKKFFGREAIAAFYGVDIQQFSPEALGQAVQNVFLVTRLSPEVKFIDFISKVLGRTSEDFTVSSDMYQKHTIYTLTSKDGAFKIGYTQIEDLLVFGMGDQAAKACVDVAAGLKRSLKEDAAYTQTQGRFLPGASLTGFLNFEDMFIAFKTQALKFAAAQGGAQAKMIEQQMENNLRQMQGFKTMGYSVVFAPVSRAKFDVSFSKEEMAEELRSVYTCQPKANQTLALVPQEAMAYQWTACQDFSMIWQQYKKEMGTAAEAAGQKVAVDEVVAEMEKNLNFSIEGDLLPALGDELGGYVTDVDLSGAFPLPKLVFFVRISDAAKALKVVDALIGQQPMVRPEQADYNGTTIKYINIPMVANLQPGYAFVGDYFMLASNWELLKKSVDVKAGQGANLLANPALVDLKAGIQEPSNAAFFLQVDAAMSRAESLLDWSLKWASAQESRQEAFKSGSQQRLADVDKEIADTQASIETLNGELAALGEIPPAAEGAAEDPAAERRTRLNEQIAEAEKTLAGAQETKADLEQILKELDAAGPMDIASRQLVVDQLAKPFMRACAAFKGFASRMTFGNGLLENTSLWRME